VELLESRRKFGFDSGSNVSGPTDEKKPMFVGVIKEMQSEQVFVPSTVRLESVNHLYGLWGHSLYFPGRFGFVSLATLADRKCIVNVGIASIGENQLPYQMVEGSSQILESVSDNEREIFRDRSALTELENQISGLRVSLFDDWVRVGWQSEKIMDSSVQISDVMFGPFDFQADGLSSGMHEVKVTDSFGLARYIMGGWPRGGNWVPHPLRLVHKGCGS
jgi:hypothetical protein